MSDINLMLVVSTGVSQSSVKSLQGTGGGRVEDGETGRRARGNGDVGRTLGGATDSRVHGQLRSSLFCAQQTCMKTTQHRAQVAQPVSVQQRYFGANFSSTSAKQGEVSCRKDASASSAAAGHSKVNGNVQASHSEVLQLPFAELLYISLAHGFNLVAASGSAWDMFQR